MPLDWVLMCAWTTSGSHTEQLEALHFPAVIGVSPFSDTLSLGCTGQDWGLRNSQSHIGVSRRDISSLCLLTPGPRLFPDILAHSFSSLMCVYKHIFPHDLKLNEHTSSQNVLQFCCCLVCKCESPRSVSAVEGFLCVLSVDQ